MNLGASNSTNVDRVGVQLADPPPKVLAAFLRPFSVGGVADTIAERRRSPLAQLRVTSPRHPRCPRVWPSKPNSWNTPCKTLIFPALRTPGNSASACYWGFGPQSITTAALTSLHAAPSPPRWLQTVQATQTPASASPCATTGALPSESPATHSRAGRCNSHVSSPRAISKRQCAPYRCRASWLTHRSTLSQAQPHGQPGSAPREPGRSGKPAGSIPSTSTRLRFRRSTADYRLYRTQAVWPGRLSSCRTA